MHNHEKKILQLWEDGKIPRNTYSDISIGHDAWCRLRKGVGECDCDPEVIVLWPPKPTERA